MIDDVRVYSDSLTPMEVSMIYGSKISKPLKLLVLVQPRLLQFKMVVFVCSGDPVHNYLTVVKASQYITLPQLLIIQLAISHSY